jgi:hypothetical protein
MLLALLRRARAAYAVSIRAELQPGLETTPWDMLETGVIDPFGNLIRFCEQIKQAARPKQ